jgi:beta-glucosidase-like glycosyl hydrolase
MRDDGIMAENKNTNSPSTESENQRYSDVAHEHAVSGGKREQRHNLLAFIKALMGIVGAVIVVYTAVLAVLFTMGWTAGSVQPVADVGNAIEVVEEANVIDLSTWSNEELAAQMCMVMVSVDQLEELPVWTRQGVGAVLLMGNKYTENLAGDIEAAQGEASNGVKALMASEEHGGLAGVLASAQEMGQLELAEIEKVTQQHGRRLQDLGINLILGPVVDIGYSGGAMAKANRTFSASYDTVADVANAWIAGMNASGVIAAAKHWPGLGGYTEIKDTVTAYKSWAQYKEQEASVFQKLSNDGFSNVVIVGHVIVPDLTEPEKVASQSKRALSELRRDVGDETIILTDNLEMLVRAKVAQSIQQAAVDAIGAGADMVMHSPEVAGADRVIQSLADAISSGVISRSQAEASVDRIIKAKNAMNLSIPLKSR